MYDASEAGTGKGISESMKGASAHRSASGRQTPDCPSGVRRRPHRPPEGPE